MYSGVNDATGQPVYEKDIIEDGAGNRCYVLFDANSGSFIVDFGDNADDSVQSVAEIPEWGMVVGNVCRDGSELNTAIDK